MTIQPGTPLPWELDDDLSLWSRTGNMATIADFHQEDDAVYAHHACNDYPRVLSQRDALVEALENALPALEDSLSRLQGIWDVDCGDSYAGGRIQLCKEIDAARSDLEQARAALALVRGV